VKKYTFIFVLIIFVTKLFGQIDYTEKINLYGRIWGEIKYYHPTIQKNKINWDSVFVKQYKSFKEVTDTSTFNLLVKNLIDTVGRIKPNKHPNKYYPNDTTVCNLNFEWINSDLLNIENKRELRNIITYYKPRKNKVLINENTTYSFPQLKKSKFEGYPNEANSMLALFTYWNRINYFFAYKDLMDVPWDSTLNEFIPKIQKTACTNNFYLSMAEIITRINDGHGWCINKQVYSELGTSLFFKVEYAETKTVVSEITDSLSYLLGLKVGDEIIESNGVKITERRKNLDKYIGGSNVNSIDIIKNRYILGLEYNGTFNLKIKDTLGVEKEISFNRDSAFNQKLFLYSQQKPKSETYQLILGKYGYIDAGKSTVKGVHKAFRRFASTEAIIIDLRKYGGAPSYFYSVHLTNKNIPYANLYSGNIKFPGTFKRLIYKTNHLGIAFLFKKYKGKIIVLIDENTGSSTELFAMRLRAIENVTIIGRNSGGYDGSCKPFLIREDFGAAYSADAVFYPNGEQTQRIGIIPDIYVEKSYVGIKRKSDEILERAIELLEANK